MGRFRTVATLAIVVSLVACGCGTADPAPVETSGPLSSNVRLKAVGRYLPYVYEVVFDPRFLIVFGENDGLYYKVLPARRVLRLSFAPNVTTRELETVRSFLVSDGGFEWIATYDLGCCPGTPYG